MPAVCSTEGTGMSCYNRSVGAHGPSLEEVVMLRLPGGSEWIIILIIVLIIFGPRLLRSSGEIARGIREFRKGLKSDDESKPAASEEQQPPPPTAPS